MFQTEDKQIELERQVEKILSLGTGNVRQVIIRMESLTDQKESLIDLASNTIRQRNMALSARECLPPARTQGRLPPIGRQSPDQRQFLFDAQKSFTSRVSPRQLASPPLAELKSRGEDYLDTLFQHDLVKKALRDEGKRQKRTSKKPRGFWTSKSMLLEVSTADLQVLAAGVPGIKDIYPNRILRSPRLVESKTLPDAVLENKGSSWGV